MRSYATLMVVDSETTTRSLITESLELRGFECHEAGTCLQARELEKVINIDLIVSSMYLSDSSVMGLLKNGPDSRCPVLVWCARSNPVDEVAVLEAGAADYLYHALDPSVLLARVRMHLRRSRRVMEPKFSLKIGDLTLDSQRQQFLHKGVRMAFTPIEYRLLKALGEQLGHPVTRDQLLDQIWQYSATADTRLVDSHVRNIRKKFRESKIDLHVSSVRGVGYRLLLGTP